MMYQLQYVVVTARGYRAVAVRKRISVPPLGKQEEPAGLKALKQEISRRWGVIDLLDVLESRCAIRPGRGG
ncbi:hypothetical protein FH608_028920 [Nonomuraea phyllanthi]|uniref:Uncharacterized protein n=1 Tax=Nonomuraea phyllanthi TaxID=2219224 RepID=A0A5C4W4R6_9ACTN|nr:hypothetical protein [Nonomuraea phyllanthi]KAB8191965.1 hypothetical protein FH608_028920 [Nonomuraea phyllanthi]